MNNAPYIDPVTKDYVLVNGNILNKDETITRIIFALECPYGNYGFDLTVGCRIQNQIGNRSVVNKKTLEKYIYTALQFLITDGTLTILNVICTEYSFKQASFNIYAVQRNQQEIKFTWTLPL